MTGDWGSGRGSEKTQSKDNSLKPRSEVREGG